MNKQHLMKVLKNLKRENIDNMNDNSLELIDSVYNDCRYLSDNFNEFADSQTNIYYSDQKKYYYENEEECMKALEEYGYDLKELAENGYTLDDMICKAGQCGQYMSIYNELAEDEELIRQTLAINYLLEDLDIENEELSEEQCVNILNYILEEASENEPEDNAETLKEFLEVR